MLLCVPGAQGTQAFTPVYMPASHVVLQLWGSSGMLTRYSPPGHDEEVHGSALTVVEKKPMPQGAHDVSAVAVPCTQPWPLPQVCNKEKCWHGFKPPLNWPGAQAAHVPSLVASPVWKPSPAEHVVIVWEAHREESTVVEKKPMPQGAHDVSAVAVPCTQPWPLPQVSKEKCWHGFKPPLNWPGAQAAHVPSLVASPVWKPSPAEHLVIVWGAHWEESDAVLNSPVEHPLQAAGATTLFHSCPTGHAHFSAAQDVL
jgi:hypothetical protein